jgi:DNA-binding response OmpR family regulator
MYDLIVLSNTASEIADWIQRIRERDENALVLAIADNADETDLVLGLRFGADAYEPFHSQVR